MNPLHRSIKFFKGPAATEASGPFCWNSAKMPDLTSGVKLDEMLAPRARRAYIGCMRFLRYRLRLISADGGTTF